MSGRRAIDVGTGSRSTASASLRSLSLSGLAVVTLLTGVGSSTPVDAAAAARTCTPRVVDLGTLGGDSSEVLEVNARHRWVGSASDSDGVAHAVRWVRGRPVDLGVDGDAWAADINNRGVIVGNSKESDNPTTARAFRWKGGVATELIGLAADRPTFVRRLNDRGVAVGSAADDDYTETPVKWPAGGGRPVPLAIPEGYVGAFAMAINDRGDVVGAAYSEVQLVAWRWDADGSDHPLAELDLDGFSQANVLDDLGRAAGVSDFGGNPGAAAALWRQGVVRSLGVFGDSDFSFALGADGRGHYVGEGTYFAGEESAHVFLTTGTSTSSLETLMPLSGDPADFSRAHAVTPWRVAVGGQSQTASGEPHATVWRCALRQTFVPAADVVERSRALGTAPGSRTVAHDGLPGSRSVLRQPPAT